ncbi:unnamed protein product [Mortierella alpina]
MHFIKTLLLSTAAVALLSMVAAQDISADKSTDAVGPITIPNLIVVESAPKSDDDDEEYNEASAAAARSSDNITYNHQLCPLWGQTALVVDQDFFCLFLPKRSQTIASALGATFEATPVCTQTLSGVLGTDSFPRNFIRTAHRATGESKTRPWIQITGKLNPAAYGLDKADEGAAYHHSFAKHATCHGYDHFLQFIEPNTKTFCLRCCAKKQDCPVEKAREGCLAAFKESVEF